MAKQTMWVITFAVNAYDQCGEYLDRVFDHKPTKEELDKLGYDDSKHLSKGGGRKGSEGGWYYLTEINLGEKYEHK